MSKTPEMYHNSDGRKTVILSTSIVQPKLSIVNIKKLDT